MKKYLDFLECEKEDIPKKRKTKKFTVCHNESGEDLGYVKWNGAWRQYCFYPDSYTHWSKGCLREVADFIEELMDERKTAREIFSEKLQEMVDSSQTTGSGKG